MFQLPGMHNNAYRKYLNGLPSVANVSSASTSSLHVHVSVLNVAFLRISSYMPFYSVTVKIIKFIFIFCIKILTNKLL